MALGVTLAPNPKGSITGVVLVSLEEIITEHSLHLEFPTTNNSTLLARLEIAKELGVQDLKVYSDSQLVVGHVKGNSKARKENMIKYLQRSKN